MKLRFVLLSFFAIVLLAAGCSKSSYYNQNSLNPQPSSSSTPETNLDQTYTNAKHQFIFKYPSGYLLSSVTESGSPATISDDATQIDVKDKSATQIFSVNADLGLPSGFTKEGMASYFGNNKDIIITPTQILGSNGYKVTSEGNDKSIISDFYFFQNKTGTIFMVTLAQNNKASQEIFNSFQFKE